MEPNSEEHVQETMEMLLEAETELYCSLILSAVECVQHSVEPPTPRHTDRWRGEQETQSLLRGNPSRLRAVTRLTSKDAFFRLLKWLEDNAGLKSGCETSSAQKLMIFLNICAHGESFAMAGEFWQHSISSISTYVSNDTRNAARSLQQ